MIANMSASKYLCETSGFTISNLALQKIIYLSQMIFMGRTNGKRLVDARFEAWDYGPVSPELYDTMKAFGSSPIPNIFKGIDDPEGAELVLLEQAADALLGKTARELVSITHQKGGAWEKNYLPGVHGISIPDPDILDEYRNRYAR